MFVKITSEMFRKALYAALERAPYFIDFAPETMGWRVDNSEIEVYALLTKSFIRVSLHDRAYRSDIGPVRKVQLSTGWERRLKERVEELFAYGRVELKAREQGNVSPLCPRCDALMRRRTAKKGPNVGRDFWGCSQYPRCKGTRQISSLDRKITDAVSLQRPTAEWAWD